MKAESYLGLLLVVWSVLSAAMSLPATPKAVGNPAQSQTGIVEEIVAKVNGRIITRSELDQRRESSHASAGEALRDQIDELLLRERAVELNLNADAEVNKKIAEYQRESGIADPDKFHEWVRQNSGESFENLRESIRNGVLRQRVIGEEVYRGLESSIATADMQSYYESHRDDFVRQESVSLREIQIAAPDQSGAAERKAKALAERISKGEKFSELAAQYSDNAASAREGGYLGTFRRGDLAEPLERVVFAHPKGYVTEPIRVGRAFEILKVEEKTAAGQATFGEAHGEIRGILATPLLQARLRDYLTNLRRDAFLQIRRDYADSGAAPGQDTEWKEAVQVAPDMTTKEAVVANRRRGKNVLKWMR